MRLEQLTIETRDGEVIITDEDGLMTIRGATVSEAMGKATRYLESVYEARLRLAAMMKSN